MSTITEAVEFVEARVVTHSCDEVFLPAWEAKVAKVNRKVIKNGLQPYVLVVTGREAKSKKNRLGLKVEWTEVTFSILGDTPSLDGWKFAATVDWEEAGCVIRTSPAWTGGPLPRPESRLCDHCGTNRYRTSTYLVSGPDGAFRQVGAQCLTAFTGIPVGWVSEVQDLGSDIDEDGWLTSQGGEVTYDIRSALRLGITLVDARGYHKADSVSPTRSDFYRCWHGLRGASKWEIERHQKLLDDIKRRSKSEEALEAEVTALIEWAKTLRGSDYLDNLRVILSSERIRGKSLGYALSAIPAFRRDSERTERRKVEKAKRTPLVEGRQVITGTVKSLKVVESQFGETTKVLIETDAGSAVWGTLPSALAWDDGEVVGKRLTLTAKVEVSKDDPGFGFYSRPTKAAWL